MKINKIGLIVTSVIALGLFFTAFFVHKPYEQETSKEMFRYLSDCAIIPGVVISAIHCLKWVSREGIFDGFTFAGRFIVSHFIPLTKRYKGKDGYYEYKQEKMEKRKNNLEYDFLIVGLVFILLAIIFYIVYACL